jgi:hypothetical protein
MSKDQPPVSKQRRTALQIANDAAAAKLSIDELKAHLEDAGITLADKIAARKAELTAQIEAL